MKKAILLSSLILLASCNGGAGGSSGSVLPNDTTVSDGNSDSGSGNSDSGSGNSDSGSGSSDLTMQEVINYINNDTTNTYVLNEQINEVYVTGYGKMERGTAVLKCLNVATKKVRFTKDSKDYTALRVPLCVLQNINEIRHLFQVKPEYSAFYRTGAVDYLVTPDTITLRKFHYAAQNANCTLPNPITSLTDMSPIVNTCMQQLMLTNANFENGTGELDLVDPTTAGGSYVADMEVNRYVRTWGPAGATYRINNSLVSGTISVDAGNHIYRAPLSINTSASILGSSNFDIAKLSLNAGYFLDTNIDTWADVYRSFNYDGNLVKITASSGYNTSDIAYKYTPFTLFYDGYNNPDMSSYRNIYNFNNDNAIAVMAVIDDYHKIILDNNGKPVVVTDEEKSLIPHMAETLQNDISVGSNYGHEYDDQR